MQTRNPFIDDLAKVDLVIRDGRVVASRRCDTAAERPDYAGLACGVNA